MSFAEAVILIDASGYVLYGRRPPDTSEVYIPDSAELFDAIWHHRNELAGIAHAHPGSGVPVASHEDVTTFDAVERCIGKSIDWWIASSDTVRLYRRNYVVWGEWTPKSNWVDELRALSRGGG